MAKYTTSLYNNRRKPAVLPLNAAVFSQTLKDMQEETPIIGVIGVIKAISMIPQWKKQDSLATPNFYGEDLVKELG